MSPRWTQTGDERRTEPEIIPPDRAEARSTRKAAPAWIFVDAHGTRRIYVARMGPLSLILLALVVSLASVMLLLLLLGAVLLWIPVLGLMFAVAAVAALFRGYVQRRR